MNPKNILASLYQRLTRSTASTTALLLIIFLSQTNSLANDSSITESTNSFDLDIGKVIEIVGETPESSNGQNPEQIQNLPLTPPPCQRTPFECCKSGRRIILEGFLGALQYV